MEKRRIMIVDDDKNILESLSRVLRDPSYELMLCDSAMDAWNIITHEEKPIDILISDNKMPEVDGVDLLVAVRKKYPNTIRIMLTGHSNLADAQAAINHGEVYKFLTKPCDPEDLKLIVKHALAHRDLWTENRRLLDKVKEQEQVLANLEEEHPGITTITKDESGSIVINETRYYESFDEFMKRYFKK